MNILFTGQATLHWGRMEFGNMGNYYVVEPFFRELHRVFPEANIRTTLQMTERFCKEEKITVLPMDLYYGFDGHELENAKMEYDLILEYEKTGKMRETTPYIDAVLDADLVVDLSGDMWGDNADLAANNRFLVGLYKNRVAQKLRPTFMLAGSPGPFENTENKSFAKEVFENFTLVTNREAISRKVLEDAGFSTDKVLDCACTSYLFEGRRGVAYESLIESKFVDKSRPVVGLIVCGWNFVTAPFSKWPRKEEEFIPFLETCEFLSEKMGFNVLLISHSNGFPIPPKKFELQHGRDYVVAEAIKQLIDKRGIAKHVYLQEEVLDVWTTKAVIGKFDMLISGRLHGAVAGISQCVPTVILDYGHEPKAHKLQGFAQMSQIDEYIVDPTSSATIISVVEKCWKNRNEIRKKLEVRVPEIQQLARKSFDVMKEIMDKNGDEE